MAGVGTLVPNRDPGRVPGSTDENEPVGLSTEESAEGRMATVIGSWFWLPEARRFQPACPCVVPLLASAVEHVEVVN